MHGFVESLDEVFETCRVFVAPLQSGAGIKGKVLDAISYGVPTVLSPIAAEGINVTDGTSIILASTTTDWSKAILALYDDSKKWHSLSNNALNQARSNYSFERGCSLMSKPLEYLGFFSGHREF
jgi:glycosyltransferase involved in cell wall biosynthesis